MVLYSRRGDLRLDLSNKQLLPFAHIYFPLPGMTCKTRRVRLKKKRLAGIEDLKR